MIMNKKLQQSLKSYSKYANSITQLSRGKSAIMIASSVAVAMNTLPEIAQAGVLYTDENPDVVLDPAPVNAWPGITYQSDFNLDLNHDGIIDFNISAHFYQGTSYGGPDNAFVKISPLGNNQVGVDLLTWQSGTSWSSTTVAGVVPAPIANGNQIDANLNFQGGDWNFVKRSGWPYTTQQQNVWLNVQNGIVGLKVNVSGQDHFGWLRLSFPSIGWNGQPYSEVIIHDYAFETIPNTPINAGDTTSAAAFSPATGLTTDNVAMTSARLNWDNPVGVDHLNVRGRRTGGAGWLNLPPVAGTASHVDLQGLQLGVSYEWQVEALYDSTGNQSGGWSPTDTFTTGCYPPDSNWVDPIVSFGARLNWTEQAGAVYYQISGRRVGTTQWTSMYMPAGNNFKNVMGLTAGAQYEWTVRTLCDNIWTNVSPWAPLQTFTTALFANPNEARLGDEEEQFSFEPNEELGISVFPNPVVDKAVVQLPVFSDDQQMAQVRLFDLNGRVVKEFNSDADKIIIHRDGLKSGIYLVDCEVGEDVFRGKVIFQ